MSSRGQTPRRQTCAQLEDQLVRRRQANHDRQSFWNSNDTYFRVWDINTAHYSNWTSQQFYDTSSEALQKKAEAKLRSDSIEARRGKLSRLLMEEAAMYEKEFRDQGRRPRTPLIPLADMKLANMELLMREEEQRRRERDLKMHHKWRQNQPAVREFERNQHQDFVKRSWITQVLEKRKEREAEQEELTRQVEELKRLEEEAKELEAQREMERKRNEEELRTFLKQQVEELKAKEEEQMILEAEEAATTEKQREILNMIDHRRIVEERRRHVDLSLFQRRQYLLMLRRRAQQVLQDLESDRKMLEQIAMEERLLKMDESARAEQFRMEVQMARNAFQKQEEVEKIRVKQSEFLFEEEAKKMYEKQEIQWKAESEARNRLMNEVLDMMDQQIREKLTRNTQKQAALRGEREAMVKEMGERRTELEREEERKLKDNREWRNHIETQVTERRLQSAYERKMREADKENELRARREEEEKLMKELSKMSLLGFQPKVIGRRRHRPL